MSHYQKPKRIKIVLWIMVIGIILASLAGVIVPYLPTASDDINEMTANLDTGAVVEELVDTGTQIAPDSILNQFQTGN
jgi:Na+/H+-dicarboxylate symporter